MLLFFSGVQIIDFAGFEIDIWLSISRFYCICSRILKLLLLCIVDYCSLLIYLPFEVSQSTLLFFSFFLSLFILVSTFCLLL